MLPLDPRQRAAPLNQADDPLPVICRHQRQRSCSPAGAIESAAGPGRAAA